MSKIYTVRVKFDNSNKVYDYATDIPNVKVGDKAQITGQFGEKKTTTVVEVLPQLTPKTTKAISGIIISSDVFAINAKLEDLRKKQQQAKEELDAYVSSFLTKWLFQRDPGYNKLKNKLDLLEAGIEEA